MMRPARVVLTCAAALLVAGCAATTPPRRDPFAGPSERASGSQIQVRVMNHNFNDATIHAVVGARRIRLGVVQGNGDQIFPLDWPVADQLAMEINVVAAGRYVTPPISVTPNSRVTLTVEQRLEDSRLRY